MAGICRLNSSDCLNNGSCLLNNSLNTTYCQCDQCHEGDVCNGDVWKQTQFDTVYVYLIVFIIGLCFSILNNSLALELFIRSRRIRCTNCGVYLIVYSILSVLSSILLVVDRAVEYYPNELINHRPQFEVFRCYVSKIGYNMLVYLCIWFSACVAFERGLVICFDGKVNASRWRSFVSTTFIFLTAAGSVAPLLLHKCDWDNTPKLKIARGFFVWFYLVLGITIYVLAVLIVLISFAHRIRRYGTENGSFMRTFFKLLCTHLFIFVPPIAYGVSYIPYAVVIHLKNPKHSYFQCGISTGEYIIKVLIETLSGVPVAVTWLLFIYPSRVYMTEFYLNTWSGKRLAKILIFFKSCTGGKKATQLPT